MAAMCSALGRSARLYLQDGRLDDWCRDGGAAVPADERLDDFSAAETTALLAEHTKETGQPFTPRPWRGSGT